MSLENFSQEHELSPEEEFAPYEMGPGDPEELDPKALAELDALLVGDAPELYSQTEEHVEEAEVISREAGERAPTPEEEIMAEHVEGLRQEAEEILAHTPEEDRPKAVEKINTIMRALIVGGIGLFGASNEASARDFDLGRIIQQEASRTVDDLVQERRQIEQARANAQNQLRQAQMSYNQRVRVIQGQIAALDNPRLNELAQKQADAQWNMQYQRQLARANTPEQKAALQAQSDARREQDIAQREMSKEQRRLRLEEQIVQADLAYETRKNDIVARFEAEKERIRDQKNQRRSQRLPNYLPR